MLLKIRVYIQWGFFMSNIFFKPGLFLLFYPFLSFAVGNTGDRGIDITFTGTLNESLCVIDKGTVPIEIELPANSVKFYQNYNRSVSVPFAINLLDCYPDTMGKIVNLTFKASSGFSSVTVSGLSMLKPHGSGADGLAIGLENSNGVPISLGTAVPADRITQVGNGSRNTFYFKAYTAVVQASDIKPGPYEAAAMFVIDYQ